MNLKLMTASLLISALPLSAQADPATERALQLSEPLSAKTPGIQVSAPPADVLSDIVAGGSSVAMGLMISPLALSDEVTLPAVIVIGEDVISPSFRSNPINDPRYITQAVFRGPVTTNGFATEDLSPSFRSNPVNDPRYITQAAFRGPVTASGLATEDLSPSFRSNPVNDPLMNGYAY